jgi:hypothetical protein
MTEKSYETKLADLIRQFGTKFEGEAIATWRALGRLLAARNVGFTDLGDAVEKLATGGLEEAEMKRLFDAGFAEGLIEAERKLAEEQAVYGQHPDGSTDWVGSRFIASARRPASSSSTISSSTTWPRA